MIRDGGPWIGGGAEDDRGAGTISTFVCVSRPSTPVAAVISRASEIVLPDSPPLGWHATHAYLVIVAGGLGWRLDAEVPASQWTPYHRGGPEPRAAWRITDATLAAGVVQRARRISRVPYDPVEILVSARTVLSVLTGVEIPFHGGDGIRGAMVCTQLTAHLLGWSLPDLFPERITRACEARAGFGITRARLDEVCDD